ncbi:MAG: Cache 3/Cache 2 fusion domain-containing protein [Candidatus Kapaibacterium sp.]
MAAFGIILILIFTISSITLIDYFDDSSGQVTSSNIKSELSISSAALISYLESVHSLSKRELDFAHKELERRLSAYGKLGPSGPSIKIDASNQFDLSGLQVYMPIMAAGSMRFELTKEPSRNVPLIDAVKSYTQLDCAILQRMNPEGDMLRIATTQVNKWGRRITGSYIPAKLNDGSPNPVIAEIFKGRNYISAEFVFGKWYISDYRPLKNSDGRISGMRYSGIALESLPGFYSALAGFDLGPKGFLRVKTDINALEKKFVVSSTGISPVLSFNDGVNKIPAEAKYSFHTKNNRTVRIKQQGFKDTLRADEEIIYLAETAFAPWGWKILNGLSVSGRPYSQKADLTVLWYNSFFFVITVIIIVLMILTIRRRISEVASRIDSVRKESIVFTDIENESFISTRDTGRLKKLFMALLSDNDESKAIIRDFSNFKSSFLSLKDQNEFLISTMKELNNNYIKRMQMSTELISNNQVFINNLINEISIIDSIRGKLSDLRNLSNKFSVPEKQPLLEIIKIIISDIEKFEEEDNLIETKLAALQNQIREIYAVTNEVRKIEKKSATFAINAAVAAEKSPPAGNGYSYLYYEAGKLHKEAGRISGDILAKADLLPSDNDIVQSVKFTCEPLKEKLNNYIDHISLLSQTNSNKSEELTRTLGYEIDRLGQLIDKLSGLQNDISDINNQLLSFYENDSFLYRINEALNKCGTDDYGR